MASPEMKAIVQVFEDAEASPDVGSKFLNSKKPQLPLERAYKRPRLMSVSSK